MKKLLFFLSTVIMTSACTVHTYGQDSIQEISFLEENTVFLKYREDFQPRIEKSISENRFCYIGRHKNLLYVGSISDSYEEAKYESILNIRHIDSIGNTIWMYSFDRFNQVSFKDIHATADGVYVMYEGYTGRLERDCFLAKLSLTGALLWEVNFGKKYGTQILDHMKLNADGNLIACTKSFETSFIYEISPAGEILKTGQFADKSEFTIMDFDFDEDENIYLTGQITSYPDKKHQREIFLYKLNSSFDLLKKEVMLFGQLSIANSIQYIGNGHFALHFSTEIDHNAATIDKMFSQYSLMDTDLNIIKTCRYRTDNSGIHNRFKQISNKHIISYDKIYLNSTSYIMLLEFDVNMVHQKSTLIDFSCGLSDFTFMPNGDMVWTKSWEELLIFDGFPEE